MSVLRSISYYARRAAATTRKEGPFEVVRRALKLADLSPEGYYFHAKYILRRTLRSYRHEADPYATIDVDPTQIEYKPVENWSKWSHMGDIRGGDWDRPGTYFPDTALYRSLEAHFTDGVAWEDTEIYQKALNRIEAGDLAWNASFNVEEVNERCEHLDDLFETIRDEGFKSQPEIRGKPNREIVLSRKWDHFMTDVVVHISRDGQFLFCDGRHRFTIARILGLDSIPVRVVVRHKQWQEIREEIGDARSTSELPDRVRRHLDHPDVQDLLPLSNPSN